MAFVAGNPAVNTDSIAKHFGIETAGHRKCETRPLVEPNVISNSARRPINLILMT
jgi:hypothetical protein